VIGALPGFAAAAVRARLDTSVLVASIARDNAYFACCLLSRHFDVGGIRYGDYLSQVHGVFRMGQDARAIRRLSLALL
jgi:hypothetical protein